MFFVFVIAIVVLIRIAKEQKALSAQREAQRIRAEQERAKQEAKWRAEMEREQRRLDAEQRKQAKEQERQRKEQERQAVQLAKHEEEIERLKIRVKKTNEAFHHYKNLAESCRCSINALEKEWAELDEQLRKSSSDSLLKRRDQIEKRIEALETKEFNARQKAWDAKEANDLAVRKLAA